MNILNFLKKTKLFTLIELIVVIVVLGILAAIVIPNVNSQKEEAITVAIQGDIRNLQTSIDMFAIKNDGLVPVSTGTVSTVPQPVDFTKLHPNYIRNLPKIKGMKYWVDSNQKLWASTADAPTNISLTDGNLSWKPSTNAEGYNVFISDKEITTSKVNTSKFQLIKEITGKDSSISTDNLPTLEQNQSYYISAIDKYGLETPPVNDIYTGYNNQKPVAFIDIDSMILDSTPIQWNYNSSIDPDNDKIVAVEWKVNDQPATSEPSITQLPVGTHTISMRVKDEDGLWSDWTSKTVIVSSDIKMSMDLPTFAIDNYVDLYNLATKSLTTSEQTVLQEVNGLRPTGVTFKYAEKLNDTYAVIGQMNSRSPYYTYNKYTTNTVTQLTSVMTNRVTTSTSVLDSIQGFQSYSIDQSRSRYIFTLTNYQTYSTNALGNGDYVYQHNGGFQYEPNGKYSSTGIRKFIFKNCNVSCAYDYEDYILQNVSTKVRGTYLSKVVGLSDTYPSSGVYTDNYWYERQSQLYSYQVYFYDKDKKLLGIFNPETKLFTSTAIDLKEPKSNVKILADIAKSTGTNYTFSISRDSVSWTSVSQSSLNGSVNIPINPSSNQLFIKIQFTELNGTFPAFSKLEIK